MRHSAIGNFVMVGSITLLAACSDGVGQDAPAPSTGAGGGSTAEPLQEASVGSEAVDASRDAGEASMVSDAAATPSGPSAGCGMNVNDDPSKWTQHDITVNVDAEFAANYRSRKYFTRVPKNYDPSKAYPVTFWGHGCGATGAESTPLMGGGAADNSIQVFLLAINSCFATSKANSPELAYFDAALAGIEASYCVDKAKVFVSGYSSGGWLSYLLGCARAGVIRGIGAASGGMQVDRPACTGPVAAILTANTTDSTNPIVNIDKTTGIDKGSGAGRDNLLMRNGCGTETKPWDVGDSAFESSSCVEYQGCAPGYPVVWCPTTGYGHSNGAESGISTKGFWTLWSSLP